MGISTKAWTTRAFAMACSAAAVCATTPAAAGPLDDLGMRSSVGSMLYLHLPLGASQSLRSGTFNFVLKNEFASSAPGLERDKTTNPNPSTTSFNLMNLELGLSGRPKSLALTGLTALGNTPPNK
jgi:hypothetical protein